MQRFDHPGALGPTRAGPCGKRHDGNLARTKSFAPSLVIFRGKHGRLVAGFGAAGRRDMRVGGVRSPVRRVHHILRAHILDHRAGGQPVLREADASFLQVGADLFMLSAVEPVLFEQRRQRLVARRLPFAARKERVEERLHHAAQFGFGATSGPKSIQLGAPQR